MDFSLTEEQEAFRKTVEEFCERNLTPRMKEIECGRNIPDEVVRGMAELGLLGVNVSPEYGGAGADFTYTVVAAEELGYADISLSTAVFPFLVENSFGYILERYGSKQVKDEVLPRVVKGEVFLGIASTEPHCGNDLAAMRTVAKKGGEYYVLNGEKAYLTGVTEVKRHGGGFLTLVYTEPEKKYLGMTMFYVPLGSQQVSTTLYESVGKRGSSYGGFTLEGLKVPEHYLVGELNQGIFPALEGISRARILMSAAVLGAARRALKIGMEYVKQREVFGKPVATYQGIQFELAEDHTRVEAARLLLFRAAWMLEKSSGKERRFTRRQLATAVAMVKLYAPQVAFETVKHALLWHGAFGYTTECPLEMGLRGILALLSGAGGTDNAMKLMVARDLLGEEFVPSV